MITAGLETYDANGKTVVSLTSKLIRFMGKVENVSTKGSLSINTSLGTPFFFVVPLGSTDSFHCAATAQISGTTLSWTFSKIEFQNSGSPESFYSQYTIVPSTIIYGYY